MFVMIPLQAEQDLGYASSNALSHTIQGVTSGIGFLGAGIILQKYHQEGTRIQVTGLNSGNHLDRSSTKRHSRMWTMAHGYNWDNINFAYSYLLILLLLIKSVILKNDVDRIP